MNFNYNIITDLVYVIFDILYMKQHKHRQSFDYFVNKIYQLINSYFYFFIHVFKTYHNLYFPINEASPYRICAS